MNETDLGSAALQHNPAEATNNGEFPEGTANVEKAREQAHADEGARDDYVDRIYERNENIDWDDEFETPDPYTASILGNRAADAAGERYEVRALAERLGKTEEAVQERMAKDLQIHLDYGKSIIGNKRDFGEKISLGEDTFEVLAEFVSNHPEIKRGPIEWTDPSGDKYTAFLHVVPIVGRGLNGGDTIFGSYLKFGLLEDPKDRSSSERLYREWTTGAYANAGTYKEEETKYEGPRMTPGSTRMEVTRTRDQSHKDFDLLKEQLQKIPKDVEQPNAYIR